MSINISCNLQPVFGCCFFLVFHFHEEYELLIATSNLTDLCQKCPPLNANVASSKSTMIVLVVFFRFAMFSMLPVLSQKKSIDFFSFSWILTVRIFSSLIFWVFNTFAYVGFLCKLHNDGLYFLLNYTYLFKPPCEYLLPACSKGTNALNTL